MVLSRLLRAGEHKTVRRLRAIADHINGLEPEIAGLPDAELRAKTDEFRRRHAAGAAGAESLDDLLPEVYAVAREAATRTLGQRHFDVQLMGGAALHLGNIAEMRTGAPRATGAGVPGLTWSDAPGTLIRLRWPPEPAVQASCPRCHRVAT